VQVLLLCGLTAVGRAVAVLTRSSRHCAQPRNKYRAARSAWSCW